MEQASHQLIKYTLDTGNFLVNLLSPIYLSWCSFSQNTYYGPRIILGAGDTNVNKITGNLQNSLGQGNKYTKVVIIQSDAFKNVNMSALAHKQSFILCGKAWSRSRSHKTRCDLGCGPRLLRFRSLLLSIHMILCTNAHIYSTGTMRINLVDMYKELRAVPGTL